MSSTASLSTHTDDDHDDNMALLATPPDAEPVADVDETKQNENGAAFAAAESEMPRTNSVVKEPFEIEMGEDHHNNGTSLHERHRTTPTTLPASPSRDEDDDLVDDDTKGLLPMGSLSNVKNSATTTAATAVKLSTQSSSSSLRRSDHRNCCIIIPKPEKVGRMVVFWPSRFKKTGWGISGPHWFGPPCIVAILLAATAYLVQASLHQQRPLTAVICLALCFQSVYHLFNAAYRDPGLVQEHYDDESDQIPRDFRWCDVCHNYQPPTGAHCPNCNVCVAGFDHHCVWMGSCVGRNNLQPFVRFNLSWLVYLLFAVVWVSVVGPLLHHRHHVVVQHQQQAQQHESPNGFF